MSIEQELSKAGLSTRLPVPSEKAVITTIAIAFLCLHVLAGMILPRAAADATVAPQEQARPSLYD
jgi:hypothetical protein